MKLLSEIESRLGNWVIMLRWPIIVAAIVLTGIAASGALLLEFSTDHRVYFSKNNPQLLAYQEMENMYGKSDNVFFAIVPEDRDATSASALEATEWLTERAWQIPFASRVDSVTNFQHTKADGDEILVRELVDESSYGDAEERSRIRAIALAEPVLAGRLLARDGGASGVNVTLQLPGEDQMREGAEVAEHSRELANEFRERFSGIDVLLSGMVIFNQAFMDVSLDDLRTLIPVSFLAMTFMLLLLTRGFSGTFAIMLVVMMSVMSAVGIGGWVGLPMTSPSAVSPVVVLTVAIANCVHIYSTLVNYMHDAASRMPEDRGSKIRQDAIVESIRVNLQPVFLSSLTTTLGFLSLHFSDSPPFRHLGSFVAFGVGTAFVLSVTFLPALLSLLPVRVRETLSRENSVIEMFGKFVVRRSRQLLWGSVLIVVVLVASVSKNELNDIFLHYFDESVEFRKDSEFIVNNLTGLYAMEYSLPSHSPGGVSDPVYLSDVEAFAEWYRGQPETIHVNVITDTFRRLNKSMNGDDPAYYRLPAN